MHFVYQANISENCIRSLYTFFPSTYTFCAHFPVRHTAVNYIFFVFIEWHIIIILVENNLKILKNMNFEGHIFPIFSFFHFTGPLVNDFILKPTKRFYLTKSG